MNREHVMDRTHLSPSPLYQSRRGLLPEFTEFPFWTRQVGKPVWPQDWSMVCAMVGWCVIIGRPRQAFPKDNFAPLMTQLKIRGKWNTTFTVLLLPLHTFLLPICNCNIQCLRKASHIAMLATVALCQLQPWEKMKRKVKECNSMFQHVHFIRILSKSH